MLGQHLPIFSNAWSTFSKPFGPYGDSLFVLQSRGPYKRILNRSQPEHPAHNQWSSDSNDLSKVQLECFHHWSFDNMLNGKWSVDFKMNCKYEFVLTTSVEFIFSSRIKTLQVFMHSFTRNDNLWTAYGIQWRSYKGWRTNSSPNCDCPTLPE